MKYRIIQSATGYQIQAYTNKIKEVKTKWWQSAKYEKVLEWQSLTEYGTIPRNFNIGSFKYIEFPHIYKTLDKAEKALDRIINKGKVLKEVTIHD